MRTFRPNVELYKIVLNPKTGKIDELLGIPANSRYRHIDKALAEKAELARTEEAKVAAKKELEEKREANAAFCRRKKWTGCPQKYQYGYCQRHCEYHKDCKTFSLARE